MSHATHHIEVNYTVRGLDSFKDSSQVTLEVNSEYSDAELVVLVSDYLLKGYSSEDYEVEFDWQEITIPESYSWDKGA